MLSGGKFLLTAMRETSSGWRPALWAAAAISSRSRAILSAILIGQLKGERPAATFSTRSRLAVQVRWGRRRWSAAKRSKERPGSPLHRVPPDTMGGGKFAAALWALPKWKLVTRQTVDPCGHH